MPIMPTNYTHSYDRRGNSSGDLQLDSMLETIKSINTRVLDEEQTEPANSITGDSSLEENSLPGPRVCVFYPPAPAPFYPAAAPAPFYPAAAPAPFYPAAPAPAPFYHAPADPAPAPPRPPPFNPAAPAAPAAPAPAPFYPAAPAAPAAPAPAPFYPAAADPAPAPRPAHGESPDVAQVPLVRGWEVREQHSIDDVIWGFVAVIAVFSLTFFIVKTLQDHSSVTNQINKVKNIEYQLDNFSSEIPTTIDPKMVRALNQDTLKLLKVKEGRITCKVNLMLLSLASTIFIGIRTWKSDLTDRFSLTARNIGIAAILSSIASYAFFQISLRWNGISLSQKSQKILKEIEKLS